MLTETGIWSALVLLGLELMNSIFFWLNLSLAETKVCPMGDLFAHRLDAYSIQLPQEVIHFKLVVDNGVVINPALQSWEQFLRECEAPRTLAASKQWVESWSELILLGIKLKKTPVWRRYKIHIQIKTQERLIALEYASLLRSLELETGVSVLWNSDEHWLAEGMVSTARGSDKVYDYIEIIYSDE